jgi:hypothetical protein
VSRQTGLRPIVRGPSSMSGSVCCPSCGHALFSIDLPVGSPVQARDVSPPDAPLLLRVAEAARLSGACRTRQLTEVERRW